MMQVFSTQGRSQQVLNQKIYSELKSCTEEQWAFLLGVLSPVRLGDIGRAFEASIAADKSKVLLATDLRTPIGPISSVDSAG